jgi:hypothetical protein
MAIDIDHNEYEDDAVYDVEIDVNDQEQEPPKTRVDKNKYFDMVNYQPHGRQWLFHRSKARFKVVVAGRRAGKSLMTAKDIEPMLMVPNKRVWLVGNTYDLAEKEFRVIWDDMIIRLGFGQDKRVIKAYNRKQGNMFIKFPWNTIIECRSAERKETLVGDSLDLVVLCEAAKHLRETWERFLRPALSDRRGSAIFSTTPEGQNWVYELWQHGQNPRPEYVDYQSWSYPSWENDVIYPGGYDDPEIQLMRLTMSSDEFDQEIGASFTSFSGKIYAEFDENVHVKEHIFNPAWRNYVCMDFGFNNPFAAVEFQVDPQDRIYVWREYYKSGMRLEDHLDFMRSRKQPDGYRVDMCFGDAADPEAIETINVKFGPCVGDPLSKVNWREGIEQVKFFLKVQGEGDDGQPWLILDHSCKNGIREFNNYKAPDTGRVERNPREDAKKHDDHFLDALRYGIMHVFKLGYRVRFSDVMSVDELRRTVSPQDGGGYVNLADVKGYPALENAGFVTLDDRRRF